MSSHNNYRLKFKHKDFICKQLALFKTHRQAAQELLKEFPEIPLSLDDAFIRVKYYACDNRNTKWRNRIHQYRCMLEHDFPHRYRFANKHQRIMELERILNDAMTPKLRRVIWFPVSKNRKGEITYGHKEVYERDFHTAITVLTTIPKELDDGSFSPYTPPVRIRQPLSMEEIQARFKKCLERLDMTFGFK